MKNDSVEHIAEHLTTASRPQSANSPEAEIDLELWRWGISRLKAVHPGAALWPTDTVGWKALLREWKLGTVGMKADEFKMAVEYYGRSSQSRYVPAPGNLWTVLREIPEIREEGEANARDDARQRKANAWRKSVADAQEAKASAEVAAEAMDNIRAILAKARSHRPARDGAQT